VPKITFSKTVSSQPVKNTPLSINKDKKNDQNNFTQILFDYMIEEIKISVILTSEISEESRSNPSEIFLKSIIPNNKKAFFISLTRQQYEERLKK